MKAARRVNRQTALLAALRARGQGLVEYALIIVAMAIVVILILTFMGNTVFTNYYSKIGSTMDAVSR